MVRRIRIGGASAFWGDSAIAVPQLLKGGRLDYTPLTPESENPWAR